MGLGCVTYSGASNSRKKSKAKQGEPASQGDIAYAFKALDRGRKGRITTDDVRGLATELGFSLWTYAQCEEMLEMFVDDGTMQMTKARFVQLVHEEDCRPPAV